MYSLVLLSAALCLTSWTVSSANGQCSKVTSYNTGLTPAVAGVNSRLPPIKNAILNNGADVMCLQEVWYERSVRSLTSQTQSEYPYHYSDLHRRVSRLRAQLPSWAASWLAPESPCSSSELNYIVGTLGRCALVNGCIGLSRERIGVCLKQKCRSQLKSRSLSQKCLSCTLFSIGSLTDTVTACTSVIGTDNRFNGPGLVLLSKRPIRSVRYVDFFPRSKLWVRRGYIEAVVDGIGKVVCTHLSANFDQYFEFDTPYDNYQQQQAAEIQALAKFSLEDHILMGDLNTGPEISFPFDPARDVTSVNPYNFETLLSYGYRDPYVDTVKRCTLCDSNSLNRQFTSNILDHVLLNGPNYRGAVAKRVMIRSSSGRTLSDHYGVQVSFCIFR